MNYPFKLYFSTEGEAKNYFKKVKTMFHMFIDKFDIDTTYIDLEQFFEENL